MAQNFLSDIKLGDSIYIRLGDRTFGDLNLYHNGTNSFIDNHTGNVYIRNFSDDKNIHLQSDDGSGGMTDYIVVHGSENIVKFQEHTRHLDNKQARFGTGSDLIIHHNSVNSFIQNSNGNLYLDNEADDADIVFRSDNGSGGITSYFFLDGSAVNTRFVQDIKFSDGIKSLFGDSADLEMFHDGTNAVIRNYTGDFFIDNYADDKDIVLRTDDGTGSQTPYYRLDGSLERNIFYKTIRIDGAGAGYLKTDANGDVSIDTDTIEDTLQSVTDRGASTTNRITFSNGIDVTGGTTGADIYINNTSPTLGFTDSNSFTDANDIYIIRGTSGDKLQFQWYDDSASTTTETFNIDSSGNATFAGDLNINKTDPKITLFDNSGANTDPSGSIVFSESSGMENFDITYNGTNDRLEFRGRVSGSDNVDLMYISRQLTTPLQVQGGASFTGNITTSGSKISVTQADGDDLAKLYQTSADGFLELFTGEATPVSRVKLSSYGDSYIAAASTGRVGIGTTSPAYQLHVENTSANASIVARATANTNSAYLVTWNNHSDSGNNMQIRSYGQGESGTVLGNSISKANYIWSNGDSRMVIGTLGSTDLIFGTNNNERIRLLSSGTLLVGKTSSSISTAGIELNQNGVGNFTRDSVIAQFNRLTTDGDVIRILKDDSTVGVIGTQSWGIGTDNPTGKFNSYISATRQLTHNGNGGDLSIISDNNSSPVFYVKGTGTADLVNVFDNTSEVFTILDGGNVGIGNTSPAKDLVINNATGAQLQLQLNSNDRFRMEADSFGGSFYSPAGYGTRFFTSGSERMRIASNGIITLSAYGAGYLKTDANGVISVDTSVVDGSGTANDVAMWSDSNTLTDAPIAISGNDASFAGDVNVDDRIRVGTQTSSDSSIISQNSDIQLRVGSIGYEISPYIRLQGKKDNGDSTYTSVYGDIKLDTVNQKLVFNDPGTNSGTIGQFPMTLDNTGNLEVSGNIIAKHTGGAGLNLRRDDTTISGTNALGSISFQGDDPTDGTFNSGAAIFARSDGSWASGSYPGQLEFQTRNTSGSLTTALTLNKDQSATFSGNVNIGAYQLQGTSSASNYLDFDDDSTTHNSDTNVTTLGSVSGIAMATNLNDGGGGDFTVSTGSTGTELFKIAVGGDATFSGNLYAPEYIYHKGNTGTYIRFQTDRQTLTSGGGAIVDLHSNGGLYFTGASTFYSNATFAGSIESNSITIDSHAPGNAVLTLQYDSNQDNPATVDNNDILGAIHFKGIDDSASSAVTGVYGKILATSDGLWDGSGNRGIDLSFHTGKYSGGSVSTAAALTLDQDQNATFAGDISIPVAKQLFFGGGSHTYISEDVDDRLRFFCGGDEHIRFTDGGNGDRTDFYRPSFFAQDVTISGDLIVTGNTTSVNVEDLNVEQGEITLNYNASSGTNSTADGAGIRIQDAVDNSTDATISWNGTEDHFTFSHPIEIDGPNINGMKFGIKQVTLTENTFTDTLTINMPNYRACYVKIVAIGDWPSHSSIQFLGEYFVHNGGGAFGEPGMVIKEIDNTNTDTIVSQIVDPSGSSGDRDFVIQLKADDTTSTPADATVFVHYEVRGQFNSIT